MQNEDSIDPKIRWRLWESTVHGFYIKLASSNSDLKVVLILILIDVFVTVTVVGLGQTVTSSRRHDQATDYISA